MCKRLDGGLYSLPTESSLAFPSHSVPGHNTHWPGFLWHIKSLCQFWSFDKSSDEVLFDMRGQEKDLSFAKTQGW